MEKIPLYSAFSAGIISFLSPCVLPLVPLYLSYISGVSVEALRSDNNREEIRRRVFWNCLYFIAGFSLLFISLGATASLIGRVLRSQMGILTKIAGGIVIIFGLHMTGILKISTLYKEKRIQVRTQARGPLGAFLLGLAFAAGWSPCIGPILAGVLFLASTRETLWQGIGLMAVYSAGLALPFLIISLALNYFFAMFGSVKRYLNVVEIVGGALLMVIGFLIFTNNMPLLSSKLTFLERFAK